MILFIIDTLFFNANFIYVQILENAEINNIMKIMGLQYKKKYETREDMETLRYGKMMIMTDQDQVSFLFYLYTYINSLLPRIFDIYISIIKSIILHKGFLYCIPRMREIVLPILDLMLL